jgi:hypothetical protein
MSTSSVYRTYRTNAEYCLRIARMEGDPHHKPFWLTLAQSWLRLAEHSARGIDGHDLRPRACAPPRGPGAASPDRRM